MSAVDDGVPVRLTARQVTRQRRRAARRRTWADFRTHRSGMAGLAILGFFVFLAVAAPLIADPEGLKLSGATGGVLEPPSSEFWLGTDDKGRSVLTLLIWGARVSLLVGLLATVISMVIGTLVGLLSGYFGGRIGAVLFRLTEWFLVIPFLPLAIVMATVLGASLLTIVIVIGVTSWPGTALLIRSQTLSIRERAYLERARVLGAGRWHQIRRHILPNVMPMVFANTTLTVSIAILTETTLSFLGLGDPTRTSWGSMLDDAYSVGAITTGSWWYIIPPGVCVVLVVLSFTLVGQALEDVLDPRLKERR
ncbi:ABC transporter permease [Nocardioides euryhalodurans]|uniref:ABC transporter permease n=1 Tax=Nocardioides euryhalodurans TaxID=2518370 RepID=A0A4P7GGP5_9ACTN|nr:ABC transporter permease [Nocardioides euryhalodurans]QBR90986.1 ABC transporter permease [Nocardioides euryhalodurans]